jgi:hypothetical protein
LFPPQPPLELLLVFSPELLLPEILGCERVRLDRTITLQVHKILLYRNATLFSLDVPSRHALPTEIFATSVLLYVGVEGSIVSHLDAEGVLGDNEVADLAFAL